VGLEGGLVSGFGFGFGFGFGMTLKVFKASKSCERVQPSVGMCRISQASRNFSMSSVDQRRAWRSRLRIARSSKVVSCASG